MADTSSPLSGVDIGKVMSSTGPIVKCVILRAEPSRDGSSIDPDRDVTAMSIGEIKKELAHYGVDTSSFVEKRELVKALEGERDNRTQKPKAEEKDTDEKKGDVPQDDLAEETKTKVVPLTHLIEEIEVDTTPKKSMVSKILGGEFTFIGQYEEEGTMIMIRRPDWENEGSDFKEEDIPPINQHKLQPPFDDIEVRGDILLMRVAETEEPLDEESAGDDDKDDNEEGDDAAEDEKKTMPPGESSSEPSEKAAKKEIVVPANDEFFLDYTRDEYLKFAARTDIVFTPAEESSDEEEEEDEEDEEVVEGSAGESGDEQEEVLETQVNVEVTLNPNEEEEDDDDEHDEEFDPDDIDEDAEDFDSEEHQVGMMNLILGQILRKFHEENGRGPDTLELLEMRKALADRLGVEVPPVDEDACDWDKKIATPKRHNKKVVVVEEKNESETIPRADEEEHHEGEEDLEEDLGALKRPAAAMEYEDGGETKEEERNANKKVKLSEENGKHDGGDS